MQQLYETISTLETVETQLYDQLEAAETALRDMETEEDT
jgi:hypothetical protein